MVYTQKREHVHVCIGKSLNNLTLHMGVGLYKAIKAIRDFKIAMWKITPVSLMI